MINQCRCGNNLIMNTRTDGERTGSNPFWSGGCGCPHNGNHNQLAETIDRQEEEEKEA